MKRIAFARSMLLASAVGIALPATAAAQNQPSNSNDQAETAQEPIPANEEIVVTGEISRTIENSLATKRNLDVIGDAIVGDDIGDLPDLSVAETLERVVGVTSDRFKGGASELSVRGLGAFLGASYLNGREISSGSDGRDVNFGQFPSELINGAIIYKSQQAAFVEGGVSGIIELQTLRPLDYNKTRLQVQGLVGYSPYQDRVINSDGINGRVTASYVDQFSTGAGDIGIAIGGQLRRDHAPEDIYTSSSSYNVCNTIEGIDQSNNCDYDTDADGNPTGAASPFYFTSNQYIYRAQSTTADRDAIMGNIQWQPSPNLDVNIDGQYSFRDDVEERQNLVIADGRRDIAPIEVSETGALLAWTGETRIENQSVWRQRTEEYIGAGLNVAWTGDRLSIAGDVGYSQTKRRQDELDMRIRTGDRLTYSIDKRGTDIPALTFLDVSDITEDTGLAFDLDNHDIYDNGARARRRLENVDDQIFSVRLDGTYELGGFISSIQAGLRYGDRQRVRDDGIDTTLDLVDDNYFSDAALAARRGNFIVRDLYSGADDTNVEGLTFARWDAQQLFTAITGSRDAGLPDGPTLSTQDADVTEKTYAGYLQANFETMMGDNAVSGNFGVRAIRTEISSVGVSSALATTPGDDPMTVEITEVGDPIINTETNDFWNFLPSANVSIELNEDMVLRLAAYRAMARPDPESLSAALSFDDEADLGDLGAIVSASGNPFLEPLLSWNGDISFEWYASRTSSLSVALYAKSLETGFETDVTPLTLDIDGTPTDVIIGRTVNSDEKSSLYGFEVAAQHKFDFGLGFQVSYNYADSDFEFPDPRVQRGIVIADFTEPANIPGYSKHTGNANVFFERGAFSTRLAYKYRSQYFKPFRSDQNRFTEGQGFLDYSLNVDLMDGVQARFQVLNILDEPNVFYRPTRDNLAQSDYSGRRYFIGLRARY